MGLELVGLAEGARAICLIDLDDVLVFQVQLLELELRRVVDDDLV